MRLHRTAINRVGAGFIIIALTLLMSYILWPVQTYTTESTVPMRVGPEEVRPGSTLTWVLPGKTCFPDAIVRVERWIDTTLPDGSFFETQVPLLNINRRGICTVNEEVTFVLPQYYAIPGQFRVTLSLCSAATQPLKKTCTTTNSPTYTMLIDPKE